MPNVRCLLPLAVAASLASPARAQTPSGEPRSELRVLGTSLDGALRRVSRASYLASPSATRSYLLPGVGVVFVLPPQTLPLVQVKRVESPALRALADAARRIEETLKSVSSPAELARLEQSLRSLRETRAEMSGSGFAFRMSTGPEGQLTVETTTLASDQAAMAEAQEMERQFLTMQKQAERLATGARDEALLAGAPDAAHPNQMREMARQMQQETERFRVQAEKARLQAEAQVRVRLREEGIPPAPPEAPQPPPAPPEAPQPPPSPPEAPEPPPPPPWQVFFDLGEPEDARTPDAVIREVRQAIVRTLAAQAGRLTRVRPEEQVVVAVDFLPARRSGLRPTPERTLVIRVPKRSLDDLQAGRLSSEEFGRRVQASEY